MSAQRLSDRCAELGLRIERSVLSNLEGGRRTTLTVAELLVLAAALSVAPVLLVFPVGRAEDGEMLPGLTVPTWSAAQWFGGHADYPAPDLQADRADDWPEQLGYRLPIDLFERHQATRQRWSEANARVRVLQRRAAIENGDIKVVLQAAEETVVEIEATLRDLRDQMRSAGLTPPGLFGEVADRLGEPRAHRQQSSVPWEPPEGGVWV